MGSEIKILLFILIGIFYFFSAIYKKAKQKQDEFNRNKRPVDKRKSEDIFKELQKALQFPNTPREPQSRPAPEPKPARVAMTKEPMIERKVRPSIDKRKKPEDATPKKGTAYKQGKDIRHEHVPTMAETLDFDPRKAVIFSEILKRPQY